MSDSSTGCAPAGTSRTPTSGRSSNGPRPTACSTLRTRPSTRPSGLCWSRRHRRAWCGSPIRDERHDAVLDDLAARLSPRALEAPARLAGSAATSTSTSPAVSRGFRIPIDWSLTSGFGRRVLRATSRIPFGGVSTYREIAAAAGSPNGSRAAGNALGEQPDPDRRALPSRAAHGRGSGWLHGWRGPQGATAAHRRGAALTFRTALRAR